MKSVGPLRIPLVAGAHWWVLVLTAVFLVLVAAFVDLTPNVDENFFFSTGDPSLRQSKTISHRFPSQAQLVLDVSSSDISSPRYLSRIARLTQRVKDIDEVTNVKSVINGPKGYKDAVESPFWNRLLIARNHKSSNVLVFVDNKNPGKAIRRLEQVISDLDTKDFRIHMAGAPYVVEQIRRSLTHDFWFFTLTAILLFGLTMAVLFRSLRIFLGMLATCSSAVLLTLLFQDLLGGRIGVLTVNLGTIVFIVTLSHLVYMTFNWQTLAQGREGKSTELAAAARAMTLPASFWSMVCASLGFGSLLLVEAEPLRELGFGGVLGTIIAFICAYLMYPSFLAWSVPVRNKLLEQEPPRGFWARRFVLPSVLIILFGVGLGFGLSRLNTDPSLLDYFKPGGDLRNGLEYVDRNGGANLLTLVISSADGSKLNTDQAYQRMWSLQRALEEDKNVGTVVSLPTLLAEGDRTPFSFFLSYETLMRIMAEPKHARIAKSFGVKPFSSSG